MQTSFVILIRGKGKKFIIYAMQSCNLDESWFVISKLIVIYSCNLDENRNVLFI